MYRLPDWLKNISLVIFVAGTHFTSLAQSLTLETVLSMARTNYPAIRQKALIRQVADLNLQNMNKGYLPQLSLNGQASYQSEVTKVEIPFPGLSIPFPSNDQYRVTADVSQLVYDGGLIQGQKSVQQLDAAVSTQQVEVEWHKMKDRIIQLYLNIIYLDEQLRQVALVKDDLNTGIKKLNAQVKNGIAFKSNLNILKAEMVKSRQREIELTSSKKALVETLALFINRPLQQNVILEIPSIPAVTANVMHRPELLLFQQQTALIGGQSKLIHARNMPHTSLFLQGGYGRPGLNLLKNGFDFFYIGGLRFNWSLTGLYTYKNDKRLIRTNQLIVETQQETFLLNANAEIKKQQGEIDKLNQLIESDNEIIDLRKSITEASRAQLDNGVATASDYLREVNAEDQARQSLIAHQLQLLQAQMNYQSITGE